MLIGLCGGICAGKQSVADYLVEAHAFSALHLQQCLKDACPEDQEERLNSATRRLQLQVDQGKGHSFSTVDALLEFVTTRWDQRWVIADIWDEAALDLLSRRPFFLWVSVDAPVMLRWSRFKERFGLRKPQHISI